MCRRRNRHLRKRPAQRRVRSNVSTFGRRHTSPHSARRLVLRLMSINRSQAAAGVRSGDRRCIERGHAGQPRRRSTDRSSAWKHPCSGVEGEAAHSVGRSARPAAVSTPGGLARNRCRLAALADSRLPAAKPARAEHDEGHRNETRCMDDANPVGIAAHEIAVRVGVERYIHFHTSASTRSKSATA